MSGFKFLIKLYSSSESKISGVLTIREFFLAKFSTEEELIFLPSMGFFGGCEYTAIISYLDLIKDSKG